MECDFLVIGPGPAGLCGAGAGVASIMAGRYPAGGINLGLAMAFGFIAASHPMQSEKPLEMT